MSSTLMTHAGGTLRTYAELATLDTPPPTRTWTPVAHHDLVTTIRQALDARSIRVVHEKYATLGKRDEQLFGTMDLALPSFNRPDIGLALGLRAANNKMMAIRIIAASRVFVCDNMAFTGSSDAVCMRKRHTGKLKVGLHVPDAIESYMAKAGHWVGQLDAMRSIALSDVLAKVLILDAFTLGRQVLPLHMIPDVVELYFRDDRQRERFPERSLWSLNNAFTEAVKKARPSQEIPAGQRIGAFFQTRLRALSNHRQLALPAPVALEAPRQVTAADVTIEPIVN